MNDAVATVVVCDAGPLIHLDQLGCLDLLGDFPRVVVPDAVWKEVAHHRPTALNQGGVPLDRVSPSGAASPELAALHRLLILHAGEAQALQIAQELDAELLLTDDTAARLAAQNLHLAVHGTLGILLRAVRRKQRTREQVLDVLHVLPLRSTLHVKRALLEQIIRQVDS